MRHQKKRHPLSENTFLRPGFSFADQFDRNLAGTSCSGSVSYALADQLCIKRLKSLLNFDHFRAKDPRVVQTYLLAKLLIAFMIDESIHHVSSALSRWFDLLERPVSIYRMTSLFHDAFRQIIAGPWVSCLHYFFGFLRRYLCDPPRARPQQLAWVRALIQHFSMSGSFP